MEKSMVPGSQTFEQCLFTLYSTGVITLEEALANADSANNLQQVINNAAAPGNGAKPVVQDMTKSVSPGSFSDFKLDLKAE
jgi:twitching motility protein PilU